MEKDILREKDFTYLTLKYVGENNSFIKKDVTLRYIDVKTTYFGFPLPLKYVKPKRNSEIELKAHTDNGIYTAHVKFKNENMYNNEIIIEVCTPTSWKYVQRRAGSRKDIELPLTIEFGDSSTIEAVTKNVSVSGLTFKTDKEISQVYLQKPCALKIKFSSNILINFDNDTLTVPAKIVRTINTNEDEKIYACNYIALQPKTKETLKKYIMLFK